MTATLQDKGECDGKTFAVINGIRLDVPGHVKKDLDKFEVGTPGLEFNEVNNILTRIWMPTVKKQISVVNGNGKNEKLIVMQHNFGIVSEVFLRCTAFQEIEPKHAIREIYRLNKRVSEQMVKDCGGA